VNADESTAMKVLLAADDRFCNLLKAIWSTSARHLTSVPLDLLTQKFLQPATPLPVTQLSNGVWHPILVVTPEKLYVWLKRVDGKFRHLLQEDARQKHAVSPGGQAYRDPPEARELVWRICCVWVAAQPVMQQVFTPEKFQEYQGHFFAGLLDGDFRDKVAHLDKSFDITELRFLRMEIDVKTSERPGLNLKVAEAGQVRAEFNVIKIKVLGETAQHLEFQTKLKAAREASLKEVSDSIDQYQAALDEAVRAHQRVMYAVSCEERRQDMPLQSERFLKAIMDKSQTTYDVLTSSNVFEIEVFNLSAYGKQYGQDRFITDMIDHMKIAVGRREGSRTCCVFIGANCPPHGQAGGGTLTKQAFLDAVETANTDHMTLLKNKGIHGMICAPCVALWSERYSKEREVRLDFVLMTSSTSNGGVLESEFTKSILWNSRALQEFVPMFPRSSFQDMARAMSTTDAVLDKNVERHQYVTGVELWTRVFKALFDGLALPRSAFCHVRDYTMYDGTMAQACIQLNLLKDKKLPRFGYCGMTWTDFVRPSGGQAVAAEVQCQIGDLLESLVKNNAYKIPGFTPVAPLTSGTSPVPVAPSYELCQMVDSELQLKHSVLEDIQRKIKEVQDPDLEEELKSLVTSFNSKVCPSGRTFQPGRRPAPTPLEELPEARAVVIPPREGSPKNMQELQAHAGNVAEGKITKLACGSFTLMAVAEDLFILATEDVVISDRKPLVKLFGSWSQNEQKANESMQSGNRWFEFKLTSETSVTACDVTGLPPGRNSELPPGPMTLNDMLAKLEIMGYPTMKLRAHELTRPALSSTVGLA
jgi:hypothetical protein